MSKLQDEIAELVYVYANRRASGFAYPTDQMVANEILDKVREALLSDEALGASVSARVKYSGTATMLEAALDAVTGEGDR